MLLFEFGIAAKKYISSVGVNEDGTIIVAGKVNGVITAWKQNTGESYEIVKVPDECSFKNEGASSISINRDGSYVVIAPRKINEPRLWNRVKNKCVISLFEKEITSSAFFSDPKKTISVIVGSIYGTLSVMDNDNFNEHARAIKSDEKQHTEQISSIIIIDDKSFISSSGDGEVKLWEKNGSNDKYKNFISLKAHTPLSGGVNALIIDRDQNLIISGGQDGFLRFWDYSPIPDGQPQIYLACKRIDKHSLLNKSTALAIKVRSICNAILKSN